MLAGKIDFKKCSSYDVKLEFRAREGEVPRLMQSQDCPTRLKKGKLERTDYSDTILAYSTMEKYSSIRSETEGSWYIEVIICP